MPKFLVQVKDTSPLIQYSPGWGGPVGDVDRSKSLDGTFHATNTSGVATFSYFGYDCFFYGSKRFNHGKFTVQFDNEPLFVGTSFTGGAFRFQQLLFSSPSASFGNHTVVISNLPSQDMRHFLDIDYLQFTTGNDAETGSDFVSNTTIDDSNTSFFRYSPPENAWSLIADTLRSSSHVTTVADAQVSFNFTGSWAYVFGNNDVDYGDYAVQIDDRPPQNYTRTTFVPSSNSLLYFAGPFPDNDTHFVSMKNLQSGKKFDVDFVVVSNFLVNSSFVPSSESPPNPSTTPTLMPSNHRLSSGKIAAFILIPIFVIFLLSAVFWTRRRRSRFFRNQEELLRLQRDGTKPYILPEAPSLHTSPVAPANRSWFLGPASQRSYNPPVSPPTSRGENARTSNNAAMPGIMTRWKRSGRRGEPDSDAPPAYKPSPLPLNVPDPVLARS